MSTSIERAKQEAIVMDSKGHAYVAIHPTYAQSPDAYKRGLIGRLVVCLVTFLILLCSIAGQVSPYICFFAWNRTNYYSPWGFWLKVAGSWKIIDNVKFRPQTLTMCLITSFLSTVSLALAAVWTWKYTRHQRARVDEMAGSELAMLEHGKRRVEYTGNAEVVYTNARVANHGQVAEVPCESRELKRQKLDRDLGAATFSFLIFTGGCALAALIVMIYNFREIRLYVYVEKPTMSAGIPLYAVTLALSLLAIILTPIPQITNVHLCGAMTVEPCKLMMVDASGSVNPLLPGEGEGFPAEGNIATHATPYRDPMQVRQATEEDEVTPLPSRHSMHHNATPPIAGEMHG